MPRQPDAAALVKPLLKFNHVPTQPWVDRGVEVLVVENQGVWLWGRGEAGDFLEREYDDHAAWQPIAETEDEFWLHHAAFEALWSMGANRSAVRLDQAAVAQIEDACTPLPCGEWSWPGRRQRIWHRSGSLTMICQDNDGHWVVAAARTEEELSWLDPLALKWDEFDSRTP
ncbi:hypothetical protein ACIBL3_46935 [Kribbella sp. NPDC050124]|uniref:hypothetical protein n=1 Tax=Kribbella sp. NPDC050124 TaxID=3364114 RepID=UPI00378E3809